MTMNFAIVSLRDAALRSRTLAKFNSPKPSMKRSKYVKKYIIFFINNIAKRKTLITPLLLHHHESHNG